MSSGAILVRFTLKTAPTLTGSGPFASQTFGLSTGDTNLTGIDILGDGATCKFWAGYIDGVDWSDSLDLSQGKGGFASASEANLSLVDATANTGISLSSAIRSGLVILEGAIVWVAAIPAGGTFADVQPIRQFQIVGDPSVAGGDDPTITLHAKTSSWLASDAMKTTINETQILDDPTDYENPTNPGYPIGDGFNQPFRSSAGVAFGGIDVSIKAGDVQPVQKLCRYDHTTNQAGDVGATDGPAAYIPSTFATAAGAGVYSADSGGAFGALTAAAGIWFGCRTSTTDLAYPADLTEAQAFYDLIELYKTNGYRIVLSNGSWFLDIAAQTHSVAPVTVAIPEFAGFGKTSTNLFQKGYDIFGSPAFPLGPTAPYAGVLFNLCDYDGNELFDSLPDGTTIQILAVPDSIPISTDQVECVGIASNGEMIPATFDQNLSAGVTFGRPACASQSSILVAKALTLQVCADPQPSTSPEVLHRFGRAYMDPNVPVTTSIGGDLNPIAIHASSTYVVAGPSATQTLSMKLRVGTLAPSLNIGMLDVSYRTKVILNGRTGPFAFWGPYWKRPDVFPNPIFNRTIDYKANPAPKVPNWKKVFRSLADADAYHETRLVTKNNLTGQTNTVAFEISEAFLWDFQEISFSSLYPVIYPFFRRYGFEQIAASPTAVCGVDGTGVIAVGVIAGQNIAWTSASPAVASDTGSIRWTGIAYDGAGRFLAVGYLQGAVTADDRMIFATSTDDGVTWTTSKDATSAGVGGGKIFCDGVRLVILMGDDEIRTFLVSGFPGSRTDAVTSHHLTTAKGNGSIWLIGGTMAGGYNLATTANFTSIATQLVGTTETVKSISWIPASKAWLVGMTDGSVWYSTVATDATIPTSWTKVVVFAGGLSVLGNWSGISIEAFGFDASGQEQQFGSTDGANWTERDSRPDVAIYHAVYTNPSSTGIWIAAPSANQSFGQIMTSDSAARNWTPWGTPSPSTAIQNLRARRFGGIGAHDYNPLRWSGLHWGGNFAIAFDPGSGDTPSTAVAKICDEWWGFAGEFNGDVDASNDPIPEELPRVKPGDVEDVYSQLTFSYHKFGDAYLKTAYTRNVDVAYVAGNDAFYFGGWDPEGANTNGRAVWNECRDAFLRYGTKRELTRSFDSIHDEITMGALWTYVHPDLGMRIRHITRQPRYLYLTVQGIFGSAQPIASLRASSGCRYKANQTMIAAQGWSLPEWGLVTNAETNLITGETKLEIIYAPE